MSKIDPKEPSICANCVHHHENIYSGRFFCYAPEVVTNDHVQGGVVPKLCADVNLDGRCKFFKKSHFIWGVLTVMGALLLFVIYLLYKCAPRG